MLLNSAIAAAIALNLSGEKIKIKAGNFQAHLAFRLAVGVGCRCREYSTGRVVSLCAGARNPIDGHSMRRAISGR